MKRPLTFSLRDGVCALGLLAILALGAWLRLGDLDARSLWTDEVAHHVKAERAAASPLRSWLTGFSFDPENGPLYYGSQLAARWVARGETADRLVPALCGVATLPLVAAAAWLMAGRAAALFAGLLFALSPLSVYYAREGRPYAALMLFAGVALLAFLRPADRLSKVLIVLTCLAAAYTSVHSAPLIAGVGAIAGIEWLAARRRTTEAAGAAPRGAFLAAGIAGSAAVFVLYLATSFVGDSDRFDIDMKGSATRMQGQPDAPILPLSRVAAERLAASLTVSGAEVAHFRPAVLGSFALFFLGCGLVWRRRARWALEAAGLVVIPILAGLAALIAIGHWYSPRYTSVALPPFLALAGAGAGGIYQIAAGWLRGRAPRLVAQMIALAAAVALSAPLALQNWRASRTEPFLAFDWRIPARFLHRYALEGEPIISRNFWSAIPLNHYLDGRRGLEARYFRGLEPTRQAAEDCGACWLVIGGVTGLGLEVRSWMTSHYRLMSEGREDFGLFFYPDQRTFLTTRWDPMLRDEMSAYLREHGRLELGGEERFFVGSGWSFEEYDGDMSFRWAADSADVALIQETPVSSVLRFRARRFPYPDAPPQVVDVSLNDRHLGTVQLGDDWQPYDVAAPAEAWQEGLNFATFDFSTSARPADVVPGSGDGRSLSAAFDYIEVLPQQPAD